MKNLKKVLAMVLAFACTFSMFAGAKVFEDVPAGSDYSEAITMLSDLGIIQGKDDGKYHPEDTITRAEACAMIARLMTGDPNVSQYVGAQSFTDVAKGSWKDSAIGYCYINGIVIGVGNNKFEPDRAITDAEFVTMVVRAMGYETADMKQNYPFSYMSNAQAIGLLDGTNMVASTDALRGEDAQVIYNALFTDYARGAKLVNTTHGTSVEQYPTLAESVWGLDRAAIGTWDKDDKDDETAELTNCKAHTWVVVGSDPAEEGYILAYPIDDDTTDLYKTDKNDVDGNAKDGYHTYSFKYAGDADAVAGYQVELWGQGSHGEPTWEKSGNKVVYSEDWEIKAIKTVKGQKAYDYNASMADKKDDNGTIELDGDVSLDLESVADNAKEAKFTAQNPEVVTFLGGELNTVTVKDDKSVEKALNVRNGNQYKLVDWDSDGDVDWVVVDQANYYKVESVNSKRLTVSSMKADKALDSDKDDESKTWKLDDLEKVGKNAADKDVKIKYVAPDDLEEGDVIEVTYKIAYDKGEKAQVITATATKVEAENHELDKVSTKDTLELTFDGEVTKIAQNANKGDVIDPANPDKYEDFDDEELGTEFALWENRNGFIVYSDYATDTSNYLMILDTADGSDKTGDRKLAKADVLFADNSVKKDVEFVSDLDLDGYGENEDGDKEARAWNEYKVVGNVYKYWMNEDGVITKMEPMIDLDDAKNTKAGNDYYYDESADRLKTGKDGNYVASLEEAKAVFAVMKDYIQKDGTKNLKVDSGDVMAVKQADIPEIGAGEYTEPVQLVNAGGANATADSWLSNKDYKYVADVNGNGEAQAAVLGVNSFNKFNDASTTVGLVTSVSYDKNDVVEIEVAYKGEVTTVKSAEDVDFDDIVKAYNYNGKTGTDKDLSSPKDTLGNDLTNKGLATYLKDNAAYAEITTNADGVLTAVTFMDKADDNTVIGHYYQVSRNIIGDITNGNVAYGKEDYFFYDDENLYSVGRLEVVDNDLADDVYYYTIDGTPTINGTKSADYTDEMLSVLNGFDGTPDIKAESESNLSESYVNNKYDKADSYEVADLVSKIGGDIVAAYTFEDALGEVSAEANARVIFEKTAYEIEIPGTGSETVDIKWSEVGTIDITSAVVKGESDLASGLPNNVSFSDNDVSDNKLTVSVPSTADDGEFTVVLTDSNKKTYEITVKVVDPANDNMTFKGQQYTMKAFDDTNPVTIGTLSDKNGAVNTSNNNFALAGTDADKFTLVTDTAGALKLKAKDTTPAGTYNVTLTSDIHNDLAIQVVVSAADVATFTVVSATPETVVVSVNGERKETALEMNLGKDNFTVKVRRADSNDAWTTIPVVQSFVGAAGNFNLVLDETEANKVFAVAGNYDVEVTMTGSDTINSTDKVATGTATK